MSALFGWLALALAALPAALALANLRALRPPSGRPRENALVSILIPARDEERHIVGAIEAARASTGVPIEIVVLDDGSTDATAALVAAQAALDPRLRLVTAPSLPPGWAGKTHACHRLGELARGTHLLFVDADVRLAPGAAAALAGHADEHGFALASGVPRQEMRTLGELLTVPMINFLLLGYLPLERMRRTTQPALAAACGQLLLVEAEAYRAVGGHAAIRERLHDALMLARQFRAAGRRIDLVDGSSLARCRMYESFASAWRGFAKNAHEGMARPLALPVWTLLLAGGHLLPPVLVLAALVGAAPLGSPLVALALSLATRAAVTVRARESWWTVPLHPLTVATALAVQWTAFFRHLRRRPTGWKGRLYQPG